jgi:hypothetical protein
MGKNVNVPVELLQRLVGFVGKSAALLEQVEKDGQLAKQAAPAAVEMLVKHGLIEEEAKAAAVEALSGSHAKVVETLRRTATHVAPASMGEAVDGMDKAASANDGLSEADRRFNAAMGF